MNPKQPPMSETLPAWTFVSDIHCGRRKRQEDAIGLWRSQDGSESLVVVADGAGGHGGGAEASAAAVAVAERLWEARGDNCGAEEFLMTWMVEAHDAVNREAQRGHSDARAVAVALFLQGNQANWVHAGDCRLYHFRDGGLLKRTRDDSVVQILFEQGEINEAEMGRHEDQNRLLQSLGGEEAPKARQGSSEVEPDDVFLLCSDGFWENLDPEEIAQLATRPRRHWRKALRRAVKAAVRQGGTDADNTSAVLAGFGNLAASPSPSRWAFLRWAVLAIVLAAITLALAFAFHIMKSAEPKKPDAPLMESGFRGSSGKDTQEQLAQEAAWNRPNRGKQTPVFGPCS